MVSTEAVVDSLFAMLQAEGSVWIDIAQLLLTLSPFSSYVSNL